MILKSLIYRFDNYKIFTSYMLGTNFFVYPEPNILDDVTRDRVVKIFLTLFRDAVFMSMNYV